MNDQRHYNYNEIVRLLSPIEDPVDVSLGEAIRIIMREPLPLKQLSYMIVRDAQPPMTQEEIFEIYERPDFPRA